MGMVGTHDGKYIRTRLSDSTTTTTTTTSPPPLMLAKTSVVAFYIILYDVSKYGRCTVLKV